jgi:hypothetical protein
MERARELIVPVVALVLITGAAITSRWMADKRGVSRIGAGTSRSGSRIEPWSDPIVYRFLYPYETGAVEGRLTFARVVEGRVNKDATWSFADIQEWHDWAPGFFAGEEGWTPRTQPGWLISRWLDGDEPGGPNGGQLFWRIQALRCLDPESFVNEIEWIEASGKTVRICTTPGWPSYDYESDTLHWNPSATRYVPEDPNLDWKWFATTPLITLAYTLSHAHYDLCRDGDRVDQAGRERFAVADENRIRHILFLMDPTCSHIRPRPGYRETWPDAPGDSPEQAWWDYRGEVEY